MDSELLELAANPLNSTNPAPEDLPDLLDSLLLSQTRINAKVTLCGRLASSITRQVGLLRHRLAELNDANPELCRREVPISDVANQDDSYRVYRSQSLLLQRIINQLNFLSWKFGENFKGQLDQLTAPHIQIFLTFLGYRHPHAEEQAARAEPAAHQCVDGCDWYSKVGPFEWSKQAYSNAWWNEMNSADWDWARVREHIKNIKVETWKTLTSIDMCHDSVKRSVPGWVWYNAPEAWRLQVELVLPQDASSKNGKSQVRVSVAYGKTEQLKEYEKRVLEHQQRMKWIQEGMSQAEALEKPVNVEVANIGTQNLDWRIGFDAAGVIPDWNRGGQHMNVPSWLSAWGIRKWLDEQEKRDKETTTKSLSTTKA